LFLQQEYSIAVLQSFCNLFPDDRAIGADPIISSVSEISGVEELRSNITWNVGKA